MALRTREAGACLGLGGPVGVEGAGPCLPPHPPLGCPWDFLQGLGWACAQEPLPAAQGTAGTGPSLASAGPR